MIVTIVGIFDGEAKEFEEEVVEMAVRRLKVRNGMLIPNDNALHYSHGGSWSHIDAITGEQNVGLFAEHSAVAEVPLRRLVDNDETVIEDFVEDLTNKMHGQMASAVYKMVGEAAESVGNTATFASKEDASEEEQVRQVQEGIVELMKKVEFGVDKMGAASGPELHLHPDNRKMIKALTSPVPLDLERSMNEVRQQKEIEAVAREAARLRRYRRP